MPYRLDKMALAISYLICAIWYAHELWVTYNVIHSKEAHPFFFNMGNMPVMGVNYLGAMYWATLGIDRTSVPAMLASYATLARTFSYWPFRSIGGRYYGL